MEKGQVLKIGGRRVVRKQPKKAAEEGVEDAKMESILSSCSFKTQKIEKVSNCSFMGSDGSIVNYSDPEVRAIFHKSKTPYGFIIKGKGEVLQGGEDSALPSDAFDLESLKEMLKSKNINIDDLLKRAAEGDEEAQKEIIEKIQE